MSSPEQSVGVDPILHALQRLEHEVRHLADRIGELIGLERRRTDDAEQRTAIAREVWDAVRASWAVWAFGVVLTARLFGVSVETIATLIAHGLGQ